MSCPARSRRSTSSLSSPRQRALRTAELAGFRPEIDGDLAEWDYGELEGLTIDQIRARYPGWTIWAGPWPGGEQPAQVAARADRVVERALGLPAGARALVFAHGHILRVLAARWLGLPGTEGRLFALGTATVSELGWEHGQPAVQRWNMPAAALARPAPLAHLDGRPRPRRQELPVAGGRPRPRRPRRAAGRAPRLLPEPIGLGPNTRCYEHPDRLAGAVCRSCNKPICADCMVQAPVGWHCRDCVRRQRPPVARRALPARLAQPAHVAAKRR